jgi:hypothetical protein
VKLHASRVRRGPLTSRVRFRRRSLQSGRQLGAAAAFSLDGLRRRPRFAAQRDGRDPGGPPPASGCPLEVLRVIRCERRTSLNVNAGCWHARPVGIHGAFVLAPGCSPCRLPSEPTSSRMLSRSGGRAEMPRSPADLRAQAAGCVDQLSRACRDVRCAGPKSRGGVGKDVLRRPGGRPAERCGSVFAGVGLGSL